MTLSDEAWTCPECNRSYWAPVEWEPALWVAVRDHAQRIHGVRHRQEAIDAQEQARLATPNHAPCLCGHYAVNHGPKRLDCKSPGCGCRLFVKSNARVR